MVERMELQRQILNLLPEDGAPVLNRVMMALLGRRREARVGLDEYFGALEALSASNLIGRLRGQGGKIYRIAALEPPVEDLTSPSAWTELRLMPSLEKYLKTVFWRVLDLPRGFSWQVVNTSSRGPREKWGRPDYTVVNIVPFSVLPSRQLDVYAFELKTETSADLTSVHQALAQTRMVHFGYLVWHLPEGSIHETRLTEISDQCRRHGIGLIVFTDPDVVEAWWIEVDAERQPTPDGEIDAFLTTRLLDAERDELQRTLTEI